MIDYLEVHLGDTFPILEPSIDTVPMEKTSLFPSDWMLSEESKSLAYPLMPTKTSQHAPHVCSATQKPFGR
ncbi:hypothetical protein ACHAXS_010156 [Conticribra weissflogii]